MKKTITTLLIILFTISSYAATAQTERYQTTATAIKFESKDPIFQYVNAINKSATTIIDAVTGDIAIIAAVTGFKFKDAQLQQLVNEIYLESERFPKIMVKGNLSGFNYTTLKTATSKTVILDGELEIHGVRRPISVPVDLSLDGMLIKMISKFEIIPSDYGITIPTAILESNEETAVVTLQARLAKNI